jgi:hypothetical protein
MKKIIPLLFIFIFTASLSVHSINASFSEVNGKVEVKIFGRWKNATAGTVIPEGATISTGFGSKAVITIGDNVLEVKQLTRLTLKELLEKEDTISTDLYLSVGKIGAKVKTSRGRSQSFKISSPVSTAAVRGTSFEYDGYTLTVEEGVVEFFNLLSQRRNAAAGSSFSTSGNEITSGGGSGGFFTGQGDDYDTVEDTLLETGSLTVQWNM